MLIDCHLPKKNGIRDRFFEFLESNRIETLDYIFLTHPDYDHFHGMVDVIDYFTEEGRSLRFFADGGFNSQQVRDLFRDRPGRSAYARLQDRLDELDKARTIRFFEINDQQRPISPKGFRGRVDLVPIGPSATRKRRITRGDTQKLGRNIDAKLEANALSVVLVLTVRDSGRTFNLLLAADTDLEGVESALDRWQAYAEEMKRPAHFDVVKVPHHGSIENHSTRIYAADASSQAGRVACISAGTRPAIPAQEVLRDYLDHDWIVLLTTKRRSVSANRPIEVFNRGGQPAVSGVNTYDISLTWSSADGLRWRSRSARVRREELPSYEAASETT